MEQSNNRLIKKEMLNQLTLLSLPLALQSRFGFMVDLLGTVMLGALGEVEISAAAIMIGNAIGFGDTNKVLLLKKCCRQSALLQG